MSFFKRLSGRHPKYSDERSKPPKGVPKTGDTYVDSCLASGLEESYEARDAFAMDDVKPASILGSGCGSQNDVQLALSLIAKYPDLDMPYYWLSHYYFLKKDFSQARSILDQGIHNSNRKRNLCYEYGCVECEDNQLLNAVKWWIRDAVFQLSSEKWDGYGSFMYLAYVAQFCGLMEEAKKLFNITDAIRSIRLNSSGQQKLNSMVRNTDTRSIVTVIESLLREYSIVLYGGPIEYDKKPKQEAQRRCLKCGKMVNAEQSVCSLCGKQLEYASNNKTSAPADARPVAPRSFYKPQAVGDYLNLVGMRVSFGTKQDEFYDGEVVDLSDTGTHIILRDVTYETKKGPSLKYDKKNVLIADINFVNVQDRHGKLP